MVMYKIDRRGGGSKNRSLGNYQIYIQANSFSIKATFDYSVTML